MGDVVSIDGKLSVDDLLTEATKQDFEDIIILGVSPDSRLFVLSSFEDKAAINFFLDHAKAGTLHG